MKKIIFSLVLTSLVLIGNTATITVTNKNNSGVGSLRNAVTTAVDGDVVSFSSSLLTSGNDTIKLASVISITKAITITGLVIGADTLFISGENSSQIFNINLSANANKNFTFSNVSIIKGNYFNGGAVYFNGDELRVLNSNFSKNYSSTDGGAIYFLGTKLTIENSIFYKDSADAGGAIFTNTSCNSLNITNSNFTSNFVSESGGAIDFKADTLTISNSQFNDNEAADYGGAIRNIGDSSYVTINNSKAYSNDAYYSGAFYLRGLNKLVINIDNLKARYNQASAFGGVFQASTYYSGAETSINVTNSELCQNSPTFSPDGGISYVKSTKIDINFVNCILDSNQGGDGGIIFSESTTKGTIINLTNCSVDNNYGSTGGLIYTKASSSTASTANSVVNITDCNMDHNFGAYGGVVFSQVISNSAINDVNITNSSLSNDTVYNLGGAIWMSTNGDVYLDIINSTLDNNKAIYGSGGAIHIQGTRKIFFNATNSSFNNNSSDEEGGAVYLTTDDILDVEFNGCSIANNISQIDGGGVYLYSTSSSSPVTADFNYSTINNNTCVNGNGAGIHAFAQYGGASVSVKTNKSTIVNNVANFGGGIYAKASSAFTTVDIKNTTITANTSNSFVGGGVYATNTNSASNILIGSSILGLNGPANIYNSNATTILSNGYNIFSDGSVTGSVGTDQLGATAGALNLGVLQNNGGLTNTRMPGAGSIAINNGDPSDLTDAQNGPIQGGRRDVGAADSTCSTSYSDTVETCSNYTFNGITYTTSGIYYDTLNNAGCDTFLILNLTITDIKTYTNASICNGDSTYFDNKYIKVAGVYRDTLVGSNTCDSIHELTLTVVNEVNTSSSETICNGDSTYFDNKYIKVAGVYRDTLVGANTCDSIHELTLTVVNEVNTSSSETICNGDSTYFDNNYIKVAGVYRDTLVGANTCDSIHELTLTVVNEVNTSSSETICNGDSTYFDNKYIKVAGVYRDTLVGSNTCDSIHELTLNVTPIITKLIRDTICSTDSIFFNGKYRKIAGSYYDTVTAVSSSCDSITELALETKSCLPPSCSELFISEYMEGSSNNKVLEIYNPSASQINLSSYSIQIYNNGSSTVGSTMNLSGMLAPKDVYVVSHTSASLAIKALSDTLSGSLSYNGDDAIALFKGGIMIDLIGVIGFDPGSAWSVGGVSTQNKTLIRKPGVGDGIKTNPATFDPSVEWIVNDIDIDTNLTWHNSLCNSNCSNVYTNLIDSVCIGGNYIFGGNSLNTPGVYYDTVSIASGCDSVIILNLSTFSAIHTTVNDTICAGGSYTLGTSTLTTSGVYYDTTLTGGGCDSISTLNLYVKPIIQSTVNDTICYGSSYTFGSSTLNSTGTYKDTVSTATGCDSAITLNLYVKPIIQSTVNDTICYGSSYAFGSSTLNSTGTYKDTVSTATGCDSAVTLNLYVKPIIQTSLEDSICDGEDYVFGGNVYTVTGIYRDTITTLAGCDSVSVLDLYVKPAPVVSANLDVDTITEGGTVTFGNSGSIADSYFWDFGDFVYSSLDSVSHTYNTAGTYTVTLKGELTNGCVVYDTLTVTVLPNTVGIEVIDINDIINIYPNPATNKVSVRFDVTKSQKVRISLLSMAGKLVYQTGETINESSIIEINTNDFERGVYMVRIKLGVNETIKKIVLTR